MRKLVLSVLGASALAIASAASAQTIITPGAPAPPNVAGTTFTVSPTGSDGSIGATIGHVGITPGNFTDIFEFRLPANGTGSGSITTSVNINDFLGGSDLDIFSVVITNSNGVWNAIETLRDLGGLPCAVEGVGTCGAGETFARNDVVITAADLNRFTITGLSRGVTGNYGGGITFTPNQAPVPEPATWAMMLFGFAGIGWQLRRTRRTGAIAQLA